ncbi:MAG: type 4a pilus biogenesis protein PilO [Acidobacteria bacterium]|nr:type 4a pilus biogenesis protein PilO [Acidobacteriota bacterium]
MDLGLKKLPLWGQVALYVVLAAGLFGAHYYVYGTDMAAAVARTQADAQKIEVENARARIDEKRLPELRAGIAEQTARLTALRNVLPEQKDVGDLLRRIQTLATQSSLTIRGFKPQAVAQKAQHAEWPISLQLEGTYHDLGAFFDKVSRMPRIINISGIQIKAHTANDPTPATVDAQCTVTTFVLQEAPAAPAAAGNKRPGAAGARPPTAAR